MPLDDRLRTFLVKCDASRDNLGKGDPVLVYGTSRGTMVPEIFTDGFGRITFREGMIRIELMSLSGEEPELRHHLIMTLPAFLRAVQTQQNIIGKFEAAGMLRAVPPADPVAAPPTAVHERLAAASAVAGKVAAAAAAVNPARPAGPPKSPNFSNE